MTENKDEKKNPYSAFDRGKQIKKVKQKRKEIMDELFEPETKRHSQRDE